MTNGEMARVLERLEERGPDYDWEALGIVLELARRQLQRLNPDSKRSPCRFDIFTETSCRYGSHGCIEQHNPTQHREQDMP